MIICLFENFAFKCVRTQSQNQDSRRPDHVKIKLLTLFKSSSISDEILLSVKVKAYLTAA